MIPALEVTDVSKSFAGKELPAVHGANLTLDKGKVLGLLGESGCGKTTLLRIIAGFEVPEKGEVRVDGTTVVSEEVMVPPGDRNIGMIFQDFALFPHLTVMDNILFGVREKDKTRRREIARQMISLTNLEGLESRKPGALSGGQQQRLALARCMAISPRLLLLDEPFSNLDVTLRSQLRQQVHDLLRTTRTAAVLVTHDIQDAVALCDELAVMKDGQILQKAPFETIYNEPVNEYVAKLTGPVVELGSTVAGKKIMIRPEKLSVRGSESKMRARVLDRRFEGNSYAYLLKSGNFEFIFKEQEVLQPGSEVNLFYNDKHLLRF